MPSLRSRAIYRLYKLFGSPFDDSTPIAKQRLSVERQSKLAPMPSHVDIRPFSIEGMLAEWIEPRQTGGETAILYLHGGGYTMGSCNTHRAMVARISQASRAPALLFDYRLAPENPYPAALEDAIQAHRYLQRMVS